MEQRRVTVRALVVLASAFILATALTAPRRAVAQDDPSKPIQFIVGAGAGGAVDLTGRLIAKKLAEAWKQPVVVVNKAGGSEIIATEFVKNSPPDGYTLLIAANPFTVNPAIFEKLPYDPVNSFIPVTMLTQTPMVVVANPSAPFQSMGELIARAKQSPKRFSWASAGNATMSHIIGEQIATSTAIEVLRVPYKSGSSAAAVAVVSGETQFGIMALGSAIPLVKAGKIRALGVTTLKRSMLSPDVPSLNELGVAKIDAAVRVGLYAPAGTPSRIVTRLHGALSAILADADTQQQLLAMGAEVYGSASPEEHRLSDRRMADEIAMIVRKANIKPD